MARNTVYIDVDQSEKCSKTEKQLIFFRSSFIINYKFFQIKKIKAIKMRIQNKNVELERNLSKN